MADDGTAQKLYENSQVRFTELGFCFRPETKKALILL